jgi:hypothetical protein
MDFKFCVAATEIDRSNMKYTSSVLRLSVAASSLSLFACSGNILDSSGGSSADGGARGTGGARAGGSGGSNGSAGSSGTAGRSGVGGTGAAGAGGPSGNGGGAGTGGASGSAPYRPFNASSPWNTPIGANPTIDPNSQTMIEDLATSTATWNYLTVNLATFSIPVYYVDSTATPTYSVVTSLVGQGFDQPVPIPNGALPDPQTDHHLSIVDEKKGIEWGMWNTVHNSNNTWSAGAGATADLTGSGVRPPITTANPWTDAVGARASGFALIAGLIRVEEVKAGQIQHALVIAYPHCRSRYFVPPASTAQAAVPPDATPDRGIPMGGRIQLDPTIDVDSLGLTATGKIIAHALQDYGAYVGDYSGSISIYAENAPDAQTQWAAGLLTTNEVRDIINQAMLRRFRVIKLPALLDNNN